jgi:hypothetical protein
MFKQFLVIAIDPTGKSPGVMGAADTQPEAEQIRDRATRAGWLAARVWDSNSGEPMPFSK